MAAETKQVSSKEDDISQPNFAYMLLEGIPNE